MKYDKWKTLKNQKVENEMIQLNIFKGINKMEESVRKIQKIEEDQGQI